MIFPSCKMSSSASLRKKPSFVSFLFCLVTIFIQWTICNSQEWSSERSRNVSERYLAPETQDYWRRPGRQSEKRVSGSSRHSSPTFVRINDPKSRTDSSQLLREETFIRQFRNDNTKSPHSKLSYDNHKSKMPNYANQHKNRRLTYSKFNSNDKRRMRALNNLRLPPLSILGSYDSEKSSKKGNSWMRRDKTNALNAQERRRNMNISGEKKMHWSTEAKFLKDRASNIKRKVIKNSYKDKDKYTAFGAPGDRHSSEGLLLRKQTLDMSQFLSTYLPTNERRFDGEGGRDELTKPEFNVPPIHRIPEPSHLKKKRPNIVLIMTDDLDVELGSLNYMPRLLRLMGDEGALFSNAYTTTPMCCPSRSSMLTGMYIHNHQVFTNHQNCSSPLWQRTHERRTFASYLSSAGYRTGYYGKYLNRYNGSHVPDGWKDWSGLLMNSKYYNYTINKNSRLLKYGNRYPHDYFPHVITSDGIKFLKSSKKDDDPPFLLVLSYPAPHGPEDSAPEHAHKFFNASDHHTASYNYAPNPDKQWMLQFTDRMADIQLKFTDLLMTKRLQTLQTIDEAVEKIVNTVEEIGEADNTYLFFTSDHGYHLGQFGLAKGKSMPFEFDVKVPFLVRGPGVKPGVDLSQIALNVDLAPTFLDIAGLPRPPQMDGRSLLPVLQSSYAPVDAKHLPWRDSFLIESSGRLREEEELEKKEQRTWEREKALSLTLLKATSTLVENDGSYGQKDIQNSVNLYTSKHERLEEVCRRVEFASPCKHAQKWHCVKIGTRWKIKKCRRKSMAIWQKHCICHFMQGFGTYKKLEPTERRKQRNFLRKYLTRDFQAFDPKFIKSFSNVNVPLDLGARNVRQLPRAFSPDWSPRRRNKRSGGVSVDESFSVSGNRSSNFTDFNSSETLEAKPFPEAMDFEPQTYESNSESDELLAFDLGADITDDDYVPLSYHETYPSMHDFIEEEELRDIKDQIYDISDEIQILKSATGSINLTDVRNSSLLTGDSKHGCQASGGQIDCQDEVYANISAWRDSKSVIEDQISRLQQQLNVMTNILHHLQTKKPELNFNLYGEREGDFDEYEEGDEEIADDFVDLEYDDEDVISLGESDQEMDEEDIGPNQEKDPAGVFSNEVRGGFDAAKALEESSNTKAISSKKELNLPEVGLEIPLIEDVNHHKKSRKPQETPMRGHERTSSPQQNYRNREYYVDKDYEEATQARKLYYLISLPDFHSEELSENDSLRSRLCWCDRRAIRKMAVKEARERKRVERQKLKEKRQKKKRRKKNNKEKSVSCDYSTLNCYTHDNNHWKTPPLWTDGQFCFCINSANNTYWCLRTINETHNFLYCEFITGLITYYDLHIDPYQLRNVAFTLSNEKVLELNEKLTNLRSCKGADECDGWVQQDTNKKDEMSNAAMPTHEKEKNETRFEKETFNIREGNSYSKSSRRKKRIKKLEERQKRKRLRKERRKYKKNMKLVESEMEQSVRIPRKSRHKKGNIRGNKKQRRKERKRQKKKRKKEKRRLARLKRRREFVSEVESKK